MSAVDEGRGPFSAGMSAIGRGLRGWRADLSLLAPLPPKSVEPGSPPLLPLALACAALLASFWGLFLLDLPVVRFLRSIHVPWLEFLGDLGNRLGSGAVLAAINVSLLAGGLLRNRPAVRRAGLDGLMAHALVAVCVQTVKHLVGRPRPRATHADEFPIGPTWEPGMDSFPSGHTSASFAVAAVLARHFPRCAWLAYGAAGSVALSRVLRGSHFPADVVGGMVLGLLVGCVVTHPVRAWRSVLSRAVIRLAPFVVAVFALLWTSVHAATDGLSDRVLLAVGLTAVVIGAGFRWSAQVQVLRFDVRRSKAEVVDISGSHERRTSNLPMANSLIGVGLALTTGSMLVAVAAILVSLALWRNRHRIDGKESAAEKEQTLGREVALALTLALAVLLIRGLKGIVPLF